VRRLTAIFAADVAGYSRLTGMDEEGTHVRLKEHLRVLIDPKVAAYRGHIVKNTGDGFLAEFNSVVDAMRCAVDVQRGMVERNLGVPPSNRVEFRIGINVGDIIEDNGDIFGDGVNVAARLEAIAEPGGICVSDDAHRQLRDKLDIVFDDAGEQILKNIERPVRVFKTRDGTTASHRPTLALPDKPSIAVLSFQNLSADPDQEYFAVDQGREQRGAPVLLQGNRARHWSGLRLWHGRVVLHPAQVASLDDRSCAGECRSHAASPESSASGSR
jgi:class 3 adenylate cyclase